jgi:signal transduction histidine kinase
VHPLVSSLNPDSDNERMKNDESNTIGSNTYIKPWTSNRTSVSNVISSLRRKHKSDKNKYSFFLGFTDPKYQSSKIAREYVAFKRSDSNVTYIAFVLLIILVYVTVDTKGIYHAFQRSVRENDDTFFIGQLFALIAIFFMVLLFFQRLMILLEESLLSYNSKSFCCSCVSNMLNFDSTYHAIRVLEDAVIILGALSVGLMLHADERIFRNSLHPVNDSLLLFLVNMIIVLVSQVLVKGGSRISLCLGWTIVIIFINHYMQYMRFSTALLSWINIIIIFLMSVSFDIERQNLRHFINSIETLNLELELANRKIREGEQSLHDKCSVVRHVSHEVRTPLNTAAVGAEILGIYKHLCTYLNIYVHI